MFRPTDAEHDEDEHETHNGGASAAGHSSVTSHSQATRSGAPIARDEFCNRWARAACSDAVVSACQASNADECRRTQADFCRTLAPEEVASTGRDECIASVAAAYRDADLRGEELAVVLRFGGACARTVAGTAAAGDSCETSSHCDVSHGFACIKKSDTGMGTCQKPETVDPGRACEALPKTCSEGFFCDGHNCIETLAQGEPCMIHEQCGASGFCDDAGKCTARLAVNDSCKTDAQCARGICAELAAEHVCTDRVVLARADPLCANLR
jgi:hypothetical protein